MRYAILAVVITIVALPLFVVGKPVFGSSHVSLPDNIAVDAPASFVPVDIAGFSGRWEGQWGGGPPHVLIVRRISTDAKDRYIVSAIYA